MSESKWKQIASQTEATAYAKVLADELNLNGLLGKKHFGFMPFAPHLDGFNIALGKASSYAKLARDEYPLFVFYHTFLDDIDLTLRSISSMLSSKKRGFLATTKALHAGPSKHFKTTLTPILWKYILDMQAETTDAGGAEGGSTANVIRLEVNRKTIRWIDSSMFNEEAASQFRLLKRIWQDLR